MAAKEKPPEPEIIWKEPKQTVAALMVLLLQLLWLIARLNRRRDEQRGGNRAAAGFDSDASTPDKQTPLRINTTRSVLGETADGETAPW